MSSGDPRAKPLKVRPLAIVAIVALVFLGGQISSILSKIGASV